MDWSDHGLNPKPGCVKSLTKGLDIHNKQQS